MPRKPTRNRSATRVHATVWGSDGRWFITIPKRHKHHDQFPAQTDVIITLDR